MPSCILLRNRKKGCGIEKKSKQSRETVLKYECIYSYATSTSYVKISCISICQDKAIVSMLH